MIFGISGTKRTVCDREVSVRRGWTVLHFFIPIMATTATFFCLLGGHCGGVQTVEFFLPPLSCIYISRFLSCFWTLFLR